MSVTMAEIARKCRLSQPAVSQALSGKGRLQPDTRARVLAVAKALGYRPHLSARATRTGRLGCIALLQSSVGWRSMLPPSLLDGIHEGVGKRDQHLVVVKLADEDLERKDWEPRILRERMADGLIVNFTCVIPPGIRRLILGHGVPAVWMNGRQASDCVHPDDFGAARAAVERLLALGHRRIAFADYAHGLDGRGAHYSVKDRRDGYAAAMAAAGLAPRFLVDVAAVPAEQRIAFSRGWIDPVDQPSAVLAYGLATALPIMLAARDSGLRLPEALSLVTFADAEPHHLGLRLDAVLVPEHAMGAAAVDMLFAARPQVHSPLPARIIPCTYLPGGSTAPPSSPAIRC